MSVLLRNLLVVDHADELHVAAVAPGGLDGAGETEVLPVGEDLLQDVVSAPEVVGEVFYGPDAGALAGDVRSGDDGDVRVPLDLGLDDLLGFHDPLVAVEEI